MREPPQEEKKEVEPEVLDVSPAGSHKSVNLTPAPEESPVGRSQSVRSGTPVSTWEQSPSVVKESTNSSIAPPTPGQRIVAVPESSYPPGTESVMMEELGETRPAVARKVPRPNSPERREMTGPTQVLVPNSDTSQSQPLQVKNPSYKDLWWVRDVLEKALLHKQAL